MNLTKALLDAGLVSEIIEALPEEAQQALSDLVCKEGRIPWAQFSKRYGEIREMGVQKWVKNEEEHWRCPQCRLPMSWYDRKCARCEEPRSERLFHMPENMIPPF